MSVELSPLSGVILIGVLRISTYRGILPQMLVFLRFLISHYSSDIQVILHDTFCGQENVKVENQNNMLKW